jgi:glutathione synthase/RimK-type ligase-like ATP-grasp enzyme
MNHPIASRKAMWKGEQIQRALTHGFNIPDSLITNNPDAVREFELHRKNKVVLKAMSSPTLAAEETQAELRVACGGLKTTLLTDSDLEQIDSVQEIPCYFQSYVDKLFELRVTVIGQEIFAAKIHSQDDKRTKIDFRDFSADIKYEKYDLPQDLAERCLQYVHSYGLLYGALDLIVTPDDQVVFLENNPAGQFWFVQQLVPELDMVDALSNCLIEMAQQ